jgi:hypothetical protein
MRLLADANFKIVIVKTLRKRNPEIDIVRVQDFEMDDADDPTILEWAAQERRILLTHDIQTMPAYAYERIAAGLYMPGVVEVPMNMPIGPAIDELLTFIGASNPKEWENQVVYLPLK